MASKGSLRALLALTALAAGLPAACGEVPTIALTVSPGHEEGALTRAPAVARVEIAATSPDGELALAASAEPGGSFDLGEIPADQILDFELTGLGADDAVLARGRSVTVPVGSIDSEGLTLFVQRIDEAARPPGAMVRAHLGAPAAAFAERYVITTGGDAALTAEGAEEDAANADLYDLLAWDGAVSGILPRRARSIVVRESSVLLVGDDGATWLDLSSGIASEAVAPEGLAFADVAGGDVIDTSGGTSLVVGATRAGEPTRAVLVVDTSGGLTAGALITPRAGAAAAFVPDVGVVIAGGAADGPGVEVLDAAGSTGRPLPFPADATTGAAASTIGDDGLLLAGGEGATSPLRVLDLDCAAACAPTALDVPALAAITTRGRAFATPTGFLVTGDSSDGETLAFRVVLEPLAATPLVLRDRRRRATPVPAPNGTLLIVGGEAVAGGGATTVESLFPY